MPQSSDWGKSFPELSNCLIYVKHASSTVLCATWYIGPIDIVTLVSKIVVLASVIIVAEVIFIALCICAIEMALDKPLWGDSSDVTKVKGLSVAPNGVVTHLAATECHLPYEIT